MNMLSLSFTLLLLLLLLGAFVNHVSGFSSSGTSLSLRGTSFVSSPRAMCNTPQRPSSSTLSMVIDRLSPECIEAVKESHDIAHDIGLQTLRNEILFAGIVARPERAEATLDKYGISADEVKQSAAKYLQMKKAIQLVPNPGYKRPPLPFSDETKDILSKACVIAESMESDVCRSEHVLLALMGYNNGKDVTEVPVVEVLKEMKTIQSAGRSFTVTKFCNDLVNALPLTPVSGDGVEVKDTVVIGGARAGSSTNTLAEVGVDLTQLALDGKLDMVYGRDAEIRSALRTLGRRRKNNPCLIGDPGVGKTAVAEGIAQVLAEGMREIQQEVNQQKPIPVIRRKIDDLMGRDQGKPATDDDDKANGQDAEGSELYQLPSCPKALMGARLISVDLASLVAGTSNRGDFERKIKNLIQEASDNNVILFIDEIHNLLGTGGGGDGAMNAANLLK